MNQRIYKVFHLTGALITGFAAGVCGFFAYFAIAQAVIEDNPDDVAIMVVGMILACVSIFQLLVFLFTVFGRYRIAVDERMLTIEIGLGPFSRTHDFSTSSIEAILVADNGRGRPAIGILADRSFCFGSLLPQKTIFDTVYWLQIETGKTEKYPTEQSA